MNLWLQLFGLLVLLIPTALSVAVIVVVIRGQKRMQREFRILRSELEGGTRDRELPLSTLHHESG